MQRHFRLIVVVVMLNTIATASGGGARVIGADENFCRAINDPSSGNEIWLRPGEFRGPCVIRRGGTADRPLVIRAQEPNRRPRIVYDGDGANVLEIRADHVTLRDLKIGPTKRNIDGVRIFARAGITIEDCEFSQLGGIAIASTHTSVHGFVLRRNIITDSMATAMYLGCHDGSECQISNLLVERNFIQRVDAPEPQIGYGIQVKLNSTAVVRDNVIADTKGPGIMIYGSQDSTKTSIVERNFITGSRQSSGILVGGGPVIVRNNIVSNNFEGGITLQDYGNRGLLRDVIIANNTSFKNINGEFVVPASAKLSEALLVNNAAAATDGHRTLPMAQTGLRLEHNVDCTTPSCFADPTILNFSPLPSSPLFRAGTTKEVGSPTDDYFGRSRNGSLAAGAIAFPAAPIKIGIKSD
jgi:hypothetical protein